MLDLFLFFCRSVRSASSKKKLMHSCAPSRRNFRWSRTLSIFMRTIPLVLARAPQWLPLQPAMQELPPRHASWQPNQNPTWLVKGSQPHGQPWHPNLHTHGPKLHTHPWQRDTGHLWPHAPNPHHLQPNLWVISKSPHANPGFCMLCV